MVRFYVHSAEVSVSAYAQALAEAQQGISSDAGNYFGAFTANAAEQNFYYHFEVPAARAGYLIPDPQFGALLQSRGDPRRPQYFNAGATRLSAVRLAPDFQQPFVIYDGNTLIWAEAAFRPCKQAQALAKLNEERPDQGLAPARWAGRGRHD